MSPCGTCTDRSLQPDIFTLHQSTTANSLNLPPTSEWRPFSSTAQFSDKFALSRPSTPHTRVSSALAPPNYERFFNDPCIVPSSSRITESFGMLRGTVQQAQSLPEIQTFAVVIRWHPVQNHCTALFHALSHSDYYLPVCCLTLPSRTPLSHTLGSSVYLREYLHRLNHYQRRTTRD